MSMLVGTAAGFSEGLMYHIENTAKTLENATDADAFDYTYIAGWVLLIFCIGSYSRRGIPNEKGFILKTFRLIVLLVQECITLLSVDYNMKHPTEAVNLAVIAALNVGPMPFIVVFVYECLTEPVVGESHYDVVCADLKYYVESPLVNTMRHIREEVTGVVNDVEDSAGLGTTP